MPRQPHAQPGQAGDGREIDKRQRPEQMPRIAAAAQRPGQRRIEQSEMAIGRHIEDRRVAYPRVAGDGVVKLTVEPAGGEADAHRLVGRRADLFLTDAYQGG